MNSFLHCSYNRRIVVAYITHRAPDSTSGVPGGRELKLHCWGTLLLLGRGCSVIGALHRSERQPSVCVCETVHCIMVSQHMEQL